MGRDGDWAFGRAEFMIKSVQNASITNTGSEVLLSAHLIPVSFAELDIDVMQKRKLMDPTAPDFLEMLSDYS